MVMKTFDTVFGSENSKTVHEVKILVVDDREDNLLSIESILENESLREGFREIEDTLDTIATPELNRTRNAWFLPFIGHAHRGVAGYACRPTVIAPSPAPGCCCR